MTYQQAQSSLQVYTSLFSVVFNVSLNPDISKQAQEVIFGRKLK